MTGSFALRFTKINFKIDELLFVLSEFDYQFNESKPETTTNELISGGLGLAFVKLKLLAGLQHHFHAVVFFVAEDVVAVRGLREG